MKINFTNQEKATLLGWVNNSNKIKFPEEEGLISLLKNSTEDNIDFKNNHIAILTSWAESSVDSNFGRGAITNSVEKKILEKLTTVEDEIKNAISTDKKNNSYKNDNSRNRSKRKILFAIVSISILVLLTIAVVSQKKNRMNSHSIVKTSLLNKKEFINKRDYKVSFINGTAWVRKSGKWEKLVLKSKLTTGDKIKTDLESNICLKAQGAKEIIIPENTLFIVE